MKVILLQGKGNSGKTRLSNKIDEWLLQNGFVEEFKKLDPNNENASPYQRDFARILKIYLYRREIFQNKRL